MDFFIYKDNKQQGPYTLGQLAGTGLSSETLVWREGMAQWTPAWQVAELRGVLSGTYKAAAAPPPAPTQAVADGDGLQKGGFSRAVFPHKKSNVFGE